MLKVKLDVEPVTWGTDDAGKRRNIREAIRKIVPNFDERYISNLIRECEEISVILNCYLTNPMVKDIDNLAKIPIDAVFFSAKGEDGYVGWESKITSLVVKKIKSSKNELEIILTGV